MSRRFIYYIPAAVALVGLALLIAGVVTKGWYIVELKGSAFDTPVTIQTRIGLFQICAKSSINGTTLSDDHECENIVRSDLENDGQNQVCDSGSNITEAGLMHRFKGVQATGIITIFAVAPAIIAAAFLRRWIALGFAMFALPAFATMLSLYYTSWNMCDRKFCDQFRQAVEGTEFSVKCGASYSVYLASFGVAVVLGACIALAVMNPLAKIEEDTQTDAPKAAAATNEPDHVSVPK